MTARSLEFNPTEEPILLGRARPIEVSDRDVSRFRSLVTAPLKGIAKGALGFGRLASFIDSPARLLGRKDEVSSLLDTAEEEIERRMPTQPEAIEKGLERTGELGLGLLAGGGGGSLLGTVGRAALGGAAGQLTEELGGGELAQSAAELAGASLPSLARKIIPSNKDQNRILELGRRHGLSEEQLAPLMPETSKRRFFGKLASTGEGTQETINSTQQGIGSIYQSLRRSRAAQKALTHEEANRFAQELHKVAQDIPANIRNQVAEDAQDLARSAAEKGGITGDELINFYQDISSRYHIGREQLELLKKPIRDALSSIDPILAQDFATTNRMYQKAIQVGRVLSPGQYEKLISLGEAYELSTAAATMDVGRIAKLLGLVGTRKLSAKMLTSPRLQNIIEKTQNAVIKNDLNAIKKLGELLQEELSEDQDSI